MRAERKEAKRAGIDPDTFEAWEKSHAEWLRLYLSLNSKRPGSQALRKIEAYRCWLVQNQGVSDATK